MFNEVTKLNEGLKKKRESGVYINLKPPAPPETVSLPTLRIWVKVGKFVQLIRSTKDEEESIYENCKKLFYFVLYRNRRHSAKGSGDNIRTFARVAFRWILLFFFCLLSKDWGGTTAAWASLPTSVLLLFLVPTQAGGIFFFFSVNQKRATKKWEKKRSCEFGENDMGVWVVVPNFMCT